MSSSAYGIDLGTCNIKICGKGENGVYCQKNMIAVEGKDNLFAFGDDAFEIYEKAPGNIKIYYPHCNGVIADINNMQTLVRCFMGEIYSGNIKPADYYIAVPTDVTDVEKRAFYDLIKNANVKAKSVMVVEKAIADGLGLDIDVKNSQGVLVVDVGYDTTEISILSLGGIVVSRLIKVGGLKFDDAIRGAVRKEYSLIIGGKTAEHVKNELAQLEEDGRDAVVYGRDIVSGLPVDSQIPTDLVDECLYEHFGTIIDNIKVILERTPPELAADIYRHGIYLTGGACQVSNLSQMISNGTGLKVNGAEHPVSSVALGLRRIIEDENYRSVAYLPGGAAN